MDSMATIPYFEPMLAGQPNNAAFNQIPYLPVQNAAWRRGDFLAQSNVGAIATPSGGTGSTTTVSGAAGPTFGAPVSVSSTAAQTNTGGVGNNANSVTITGVATSGAPAATYYVQLTYTLTANESLTGAEFIVNCAPGYTFSVNVLSGTAPTGATNYAAYASLFPGYEALQQATTTTTALGTAFSISYPLVAAYGVSRAATNASANIVGLAVNSSLADYYSGTGGSFQVNENSLFGASNSQQPLQPNEAFLSYVVKLQNSVPLEMSLKQQWSPALAGTTAGIAIDAATGFFIADTSQSNKILTISAEPVVGVPSVVGNGTETSGKRIQVYFNSGLI